MSEHKDESENKPANDDARDEQSGGALSDESLEDVAGGTKWIKPWEPPPTFPEEPTTW